MTLDERYTVWPARLVGMAENLAAWWEELRERDSLARPEPIRGPRVREFGHPAESASDKAAEIAGLLNSLSATLSPHWGDDDPAPPPRDESVRIATAVAHVREVMSQADAHARIEALGDHLRMRLIQLYTQLAREFGRLDPEPKGDLTCPNCWPAAKLTGMMWDDREKGRYFRCILCGLEMSADDYEAYRRAYSDGVKADGAAVLVPMKTAASHFNIPLATVKSWLRRGRLTRHEQDGRVLVDVMEIKTLRSAQDAPCEASKPQVEAELDTPGQG